MLGKVFWAGALAEIGGRDPGELELALHELARKELVRPARDELDGGRERVLVLASARARRCLRPDPEGGARAPPSLGGRLDRASSGRAGRGPGRGARAPLPAGARARGGGRRHGAGRGTRRAGAALPRARRRAGARPRYRPGGGTARPGARADAFRGSRAARPPRPLGGRGLAGRPSARRGRGARRGARLPPCPRRDGSAPHRALQLHSRVALRLGEGRQVALAAEAVALLGAGDARAGARRRLRAARERARDRRAPTRRRSRPPTVRARLPRRSAYPSRRARSAIAATPAPISATRTASPRWSGHSPCSSNEERAGTPPSCRTTSRSPATRSKARHARSPPSSEGIAFCEQRGLTEARAVLESNCPALLVELGRPKRSSMRHSLAAHARGERRHALADRGARSPAREPPGPRRADNAQRGGLADRGGAGDQSCRYHWIRVRLGRHSACRGCSRAGVRLARGARATQRALATRPTTRDS